MTKLRPAVRTNCKNIEHRPSLDSLKDVTTWTCDRCSRAGYFFSHEFVVLDYETWKEVV